MQNAIHPLPCLHGLFKHFLPSTAESAQVFIAGHFHHFSATDQLIDDFSGLIFGGLRAIWKINAQIIGCSLHTRPPPADAQTMKSTIIWKPKVVLNLHQALLEK